MKKTIKSLLIGFLMFVVIWAIFYGLSGSDYGIRLSCKDYTIKGLVGLTPPLMAVIQPQYCIVFYEARVNGELVCSGKSTLNFEEDVVRCGGLKKYFDEPINITVNFYDLDMKTKLGEDNRLFNKN